MVTLGPIGNNAIKAINEIESGNSRAKGAIAHYDLRFLKPIDSGMLKEIGRKFGTVVTIEDGSLQGGMGSAVTEWMADNGFCPRTVRLGLPDRFVEHGTVTQLQKITGIDKDSIKDCLEKLLDNNFPTTIKQS